MSSRLGPVFDAEMKVGARRRALYAGRSLFVAALLVGMASIGWAYYDPRSSATIQDQAEVGRAYFFAMVGVQLALTMIVAPAATAGAVCVERSRGSLAHMLVTDLTAREIILGKLLARLLPTFALVACAWPVAALGTLLGGIGPEDLTMAFAITLAVGVLGCSLALALSTWARTVHEVLLAVYTGWGAVLLAYPIALALSASLGMALTRPWMLVANPFWLAYAPYIAPGRCGPGEYGGFFGAALGGSALCIAAAIAGVRVNPLGEARPRRKARTVPGLGLMGRLARRLPGPSLDADPVLWREWHRTRASRPMRAVMVGLLLASTAACAEGAGEILREGIGPRAGFAGVMAALVQATFGLLAVAVFASLSFAEERRRGSLDVLLATPLSTRSIVRAKWLATFRTLPLLAIGPALIGAAFALRDPGGPGMPPAGPHGLLGTGRALAAALMPLTILAHGAWAASLGLALSVRVRREGRAIALAAAAYVIQVIGVPMIAIVLSPGGGGPFSAIAPILASGPAFATIQLVEALAGHWEDATTALTWIAAWDLLALGGALILLRSTARVFDREFDRVPECRSPARSRRESRREGAPSPGVVAGRRGPAWDRPGRPGVVAATDPPARSGRMP